MHSHPADQAARAYCAAIGGDTDAFVALFSTDVHLEDPVGTPPLVGHEGVAKFHGRLKRAWSQFQMQADEVFVRDGRAAIRWTAAGRSASGKDIRFGGINVLAVDDAGQIRRLEGYWDMDAMVAQM